MTHSYLPWIAAGLFALAVVHTFSTKFFEHLAHTNPRHAGIWHLLGEVEVVFGFWAMVLTATMFFMVGKAPTLTAAGMGARVSKGKDTLYKHAIEGFTGPDGGIMPPKGGNPALTDEQVHATVDWMLANIK